MVILYYEALFKSGLNTGVATFHSCEVGSLTLVVFLAQQE